MTQAEPRIALITSSTTSNAPESWQVVTSFESLQQLDAIDMVVIDAPPVQLRALVRRLRSHNLYRLLPIYSAQESDEPLLDGTLPSDPTAIIPLWRLWREKQNQFNRGRPPERFDERVLAWLWARPRTRIEPERITQSPAIYHYPLIQTMSSDEPVNEMVWLRMMEEQGWFERGDLIDRIRLCQSCNSGHLNYVDTCPQCRSLEITRQPALHCFTCGHVGAQEQFIKDGIMICPNCLTRLRHIGSDYDRPLENYRCHSCNNFFIDADVEARCLDCDEHHQPDELRIREIRPYRLTESAHLKCRQGLEEAGTDSYFGRLNLISPKAFSALLDWQIQQSRRYADPPVGSLLVRRFATLRQRINDAQAMALLDGLMDRIQEAIRETDRCTRTNEEQLWLLLPHTDHDGMQQLRRRLGSLAGRFHDQDELAFDIRIAGLAIPTDLLGQEDASLLMARLGGEVSE